MLNSGTTMQTLSTPYFDLPSPTIRDTLGALGSPLRGVVRFFAPWTKAEPATRTRNAVTAAPAEPATRASKPAAPNAQTVQSAQSVQSAPCVQSVLATPSVHAPSRFAANASRFSTPVTAIKPAATANSVRALRVIDGSCTTQSAGRMKIVGRFSDVCAELDRMCKNDSSESSR
jgi:hypothetical protein